MIDRLENAKTPLEKNDVRKVLCHAEVHRSRSDEKVLWVLFVVWEPSNNLHGSKFRYPGAGKGGRWTVAISRADRAVAILQP
jgi:hypothetical protein